MSAERPTTVLGFTIDGETSKDLDDAIWVVAKPGGGYRVTVCIADVAAAVGLGSALDEAARHRVETRYLRVGNRPMLPRELSEGSLSLLPGCRRRVLALTVDLGRDGTPEAPVLEEAVLVSAAQLDHETTDHILQGQPHPLREQLLLCQEVARVLLARRQAGGACVVYDPVKKVYADEDGVLRPLRGSAHAQIIVQEFMILANERVANWMARSGRAMLFRNHQARVVAPGREEILRQIGEASLRPDLMPALQERMALWMERAVYSPVLLGHYALNLPAYTHFTSPIRRYADLVNHRLVKAAIQGEAVPYDRDALEAISGAINAWKIEQAEATQEHFKQKAIDERRHALGQASTRGFAGLDAAAFSRVLEQAAKDDNLVPELAAAVLDRELAPIDLFHLLFRGGPQWTDIRQSVLEKLQAAPHVATTILEIVRQKDGAEVVQEVVATQGGFLGRLTVTYQGHSLTCPEPAQAQGKKAALALGALGWLEGWVDDSLVTPEGIPPLETAVGPSGGEAGEDHVSALNLWCQERKAGEPTYDFVKEGADHQPEFRATVAVNVGGRRLEAVGEPSPRKKDAKQSAAGRLQLELLS